MRFYYPSLLGLVWALAVSGPGRAQAPVVLEVLPRANAVAVPRTAAVQLTFSQPLSAQAVQPDAVRVVSRWRGQLPGSYAGAGTSRLTFTPARPLLAGEPVRVNVTRRATSQAGLAPAAPTSYDFTTAVTGNAQFAHENVPLIGYRPTHLATGDLNGDGHLDFVTTGGVRAFNGIGNVAVRLGDGQAGFESPPAPRRANVDSGAEEPLDLELADLNKDGRLDLLVLDSRTQGSLFVSLGDGAGGFAPSGTRVLAAGDTPRGLAVGDINGDGHLDVATATGVGGTRTVVLGLGDGRGGFVAAPAPSAGTAPVEIQLADLNGDGRLDLLAVNSFTSRAFVAVRLGDGRGGFATPAVPEVNVGAGAVSLTVGDVNGDGRLDLLTTNILTNPNSVSVRLGDGAGGFVAPAAPEVSVGGEPRRVALGDLNGDGRLDFVTADHRPDGTSLSVRLGDGRGAFTVAPDLAAGLTPRDVVLADFNRDGRPDALVANDGLRFASTTASTSSVSVRVSDGTGRFVTPGGARVPLNDAAYAVAVGDLNGDGRLDLLTNGRGAQGFGVVDVRLGNGAGGFVAPPAPTPATVSAADLGAIELALGDLDHDGNLDFVVSIRAAFRNGAAAYMGDGRGGFRRGAVVEQLARGTGDFVLADVTGDGDLDLLAVNVAIRGETSMVPEGVLVLRGDGRGSFAAPTVVSVPPSPAGLAAADVNGDGKLDLVTTHFYDDKSRSGSVTVRLGDGAGGFAAAPGAGIDPLPDRYQPNGLVLGDLNDDGRLDLVLSVRDGARGEGYAVLVRLGDGAGGFTQAPMPEMLLDEAAAGLALGDLNGDGRLDYTFGVSSQNRISLRLGDGQGGFTVPVRAATIGLDNLVGRPTLADLDNDGDLDMFVPAGTASYISVRLNGGGGSGPALSTAGGGAPPAQARRLELYPNPAHHAVTVTGLGAGRAALVVLDLLGREQLRQAAGPRLDLTSLQPGVYVVRCGSQTARLVVE